MNISGLIIREPWISLILSGKKTWELRGTKTKKSETKETIALIKSGSKKILGTCKIINVHGPLSKDELMNTVEFHQSPIEEIDEILKFYKKVYGWELGEIHVFDNPINYIPKKGAIIWVTVELEDKYAEN